MIKIRFSLSAILWVSWLSASMASAKERFVPSGGTLNYPTIQAAILASASGDVVRVQPGVYAESISFRALNITLTSMDPSDPGVVRSTILQGDGRHSVVSIAGGQTTNALLTGFTIRGGGGTAFTADIYNFLDGGAIYCLQSSPSIIGNIIEENHVATNLSNVLSYGGGIAILGGSPRIARNVLRNNSAYTGGGIHSDSGTPIIEDNWIYSNTAIIGGGAFLQDSGQFLNNTVVGNTGDNVNVEGTLLVMNNIIVLARGPGMAIGPLANGVSHWYHFNDSWGNEAGDVVQFLEADFRGAPASPLIPASLEATHGNFSADPMFAGITNSNFRLSPDSPCVNAGEPRGWRSTNDVDLDGGPRVVASRVDLGASELHPTGNEPPSADAGAGRTVSWNPGEAVTLDGSRSTDPNGLPLRFSWSQTAGPSVALAGTNAVGSFTPTGLGEYRFDLIVNNGVHNSRPDSIRILITNLPPIANAGFDRTFPSVPETLTLDGSHSLDPEGQTLRYQWRQVAGPAGQWTSLQTPRPVFKPAGPGAYVFELTASDAFQTSAPSQIVLYLGDVPPVAKAGPTRYAGQGSITLDGSKSFAPNNPAPMEYAWRQVAGPGLALDKTNTPYPVVHRFRQLTNVQEAVFELTVRAGDSASATDTVKVVIVPTWRNTTLRLSNPPFRRNLPTLVGFSGGDCDSGDAMSFPSSWRPLANLFATSYTRDAGSSLQRPEYLGYGDQLITILSQLAPEYDQPIQTLGWSTGSMPAADVAERLNIAYRDPRYLVNRISFLDSGCFSARYTTNTERLLANRMAGKVFWIDNYFAQAGIYRPGTLNIQFPSPPAVHATPNDWYLSSWNMASGFSETNFNEGRFGGAFFSVIGPGRNHQVELGKSDYDFGWAAPKSSAFPLSDLVSLLPTSGRLPGVVQLNGAEDGVLAKPGGVLFSCQPVLNAVKYEILLGSSARRLDWVASTGDAPPGLPLSELPFPDTWWTVRATDAIGSTSQSDPRVVHRDSDGDGLSDAMEVYVYHTDPYTADTDGDGRPDGQEVLAGLDPLSPQDGFRFGCQLLPANQLLLSWFADPGSIYDVEFSAALSSTSWQSVESVDPGVAGGFIQHAIPRPQGQLAFFRLRSRPR